MFLANQWNIPCIISTLSSSNSSSITASTVKLIYYSNIHIRLQNRNFIIDACWTLQHKKGIFVHFMNWSKFWCNIFTAKPNQTWKNTNLSGNHIFVQRLRSKPWTYKSKVLFFFLSFFHSVSNFLGASLDKALVSGRGSDIPLIQDIEPSNTRAWLSYATLRFSSLTEHCHTQIFYLRCRILMP